MERLERLIQVGVAFAGFINAGAIALQGWELYQVKSSVGHSLIMYFVFLFIQGMLVLNSMRLKDKWQASGMLASMVTTTGTILLISHYRNWTGYAVALTFFIVFMAGFIGIMRVFEKEFDDQTKRQDN